MATSAKWLSPSQAAAVVGTLGFPSKMPGTSYGIPAKFCNVGAKLRPVKGTTCAKCYAFKGRYTIPGSSVEISQAVRFASLDDPQWSFAMASALLHAHGMAGREKLHRKIKQGGKGWHRWHDSGDLQSMKHLCNIVVVAQLTPRIRHWLPTREASLIAQFLKNGGEFPANLTVRVSATMIDGSPSKAFANTSTVHAKSAAQGHSCPAPQQGGICGPCRACWDRAVENTSYHVH
jgi:hypothetical protein